jgi:hypothetical protein
MQLNTAVNAAMHPASSAGVLQGARWWPSNSWHYTDMIASMFLQASSSTHVKLAVVYAADGHLAVLNTLRPAH